jgi:hypothetical protein
MIANRRFNPVEILAARFPFTLLERRPPEPVPASAAGSAVSVESAICTKSAVPVDTVIPAPRSASPLDSVPPSLGRERYVLCDDCLGPAVIEARVPRDPEPHEVCETCAQAPYYDGAWTRPLVRWA